jgi:hypothetical protein
VVLTSESGASSDDGGHVSDGNLTGGADGDTDDNAEHALECAYASTKAMGDADRVGGVTHRLKSERTADVRTIFVKKDDYKDPHTGLVESGHVCTICQ